MRRVSVLAALGCAMACVGQLTPGQESTNPPRFARVLSPKSGKVPKPPACPAKFDDSLETNGVVPIGKVPGVTQPEALVSPEAEFSEKARKEMRKRGIGEVSSTIAFVVDKDGRPRDLCVQKSAEFDLDVEAARAVTQYRFDPATKDGEAVAKRIQIQVRWRLY